MGRITRFVAVTKAGVSFGMLIFVFLNCSFAYTSFELNRQRLDRFKNPTATKCDWNRKSKEYCTQKKANCNHLDNGQACCSCLCEEPKSTFDLSKMTCEKNEVFRAGCDLRFRNIYTKMPLKILDLSDDGSSEVVWQVKNSDDKLQSCQIDSIAFNHNGINVGKFISVVKTGKDNHLHVITIKWKDDLPSNYDGNVFKVNVNCSVARTRARSTRYDTGCFVFKSFGRITISPPTSPPSTSTFTSTTASLKSGTSLSPTTEPDLVQSSSTMLSSPKTSSQPAQTTTSTVFHPSSAGPEKHTKSSEGNGNTPVPSKKQPDVVPKTSRIPGTFNSNVDPNAAEQSDGGGGNVAMVSSVVVVVVLVLVGILLFVLWTRRKSGMKQRQQSQTAILNHGGANMTAHNEMSMNNFPENIYAEADSVVSPRSVREDNCVYEYADNNHYTDLNKKIPEKEHDYQALVTGNLYEHIPSSSLKPAINEQPAISEPFYHVVDGQTVDNEAVDSQAASETVYNVPDDPTQPGNYEAPDKAIPRGPGNDQSERVYSILEDDENDASLPTPESNYLAVLPPEQLHYEQPVDVPISRT